MPPQPHTRPTDPLLRLDATALAAATTSGELTCAEITRSYLARLNSLNPTLHAVITVNPRAQADAEALDDLPAHARGPLHGVPLLIKDNIDVAGLPTTAGSALLRDHRPPQDAPLVARLRRAGAVILGKANMTEWANFMTLGMPNGYSSLGGQTVNPWDDTLDTGGSSSGSGVAVAAHLCAAAIGTETSGSIVSPAHQNGVIGLKPTLGLIPRTGIIPISHSQDTAGPLTRSARDAALLLGVMTGPDAADPASLTVTVPPPHPSGDTLSGLTIGVIQDEPHVTPAEQQAQATAEAALTRAGATLRPVTLPARAALNAAGWMLDVLVYEFKHDLNAYLRGVQDGPRSLTEVLAANDRHPELTLRYGQHLLHAAEGTRGDLSEQAYHQARQRDLRLTRTENLDPLFQGGVHTLLFPGIHSYALAAKAGYPSISVPHLPDGAPTGVLLMALAGHDHTLLLIAAHLAAASLDLPDHTP